MKDAVVIAGGNSQRGLLLRDKLTAERYDARFCRSLKEFGYAINRIKIATILLLFPDEFGIVRELLESNLMSGLAGMVPVVFISTSSAENNNARSLRYNADDFLIEPISTDEIAKFVDDYNCARPRSESEHILTVGELVLNRETLVVTWRNKRLPLYPQQVHLLEFLMLNPNRPVTRVELLNNVWRTHIAIDHRTIDRNIKRIRDAFKSKAKQGPIRTIPRVGYMLDLESSNYPRIQKTAT